ncbi:type II 3-dehydroquinate dehydratase [Ignavibacteriales bacterium]
MKIAVINGANLNLLGERDESKYGTTTLQSIEQKLKAKYPEIEFEFFQSNLEGVIINKLHQLRKSDFNIIINPGGYAHSSVAIRDALEMISQIKVEVHLSHLANRESFRHTLITATACNGYISGFKETGYLAAVEIIKDLENGN